MPSKCQALLKDGVERMHTALPLRSVVAVGPRRVVAAILIAIIVINITSSLSFLFHCSLLFSSQEGKCFSGFRQENSQELVDHDKARMNDTETGSVSGLWHLGDIQRMQDQGGPVPWRDLVGQKGRKRVV